MLACQNRLNHGNHSALPSSPASHLGNIHKPLQTVTFAFGHRTYARNTIEGIGLLHYKALHMNDASSFTFAENSATFCNFAEIVVHYGEDESSTPGDITRTIIQRMLRGECDSSAFVLIVGSETKYIGENRRLPGHTCCV